MSRVVLKERQFEPTGINLGEFNSADLESFDLQYKDTDDSGSDGQGAGSSDEKKKSSVPDPVDDNPLEKDDNNQSKKKSSGGQSGQSSQDSSGNQEQEESDEPEGVDDIPDEWDPYGDNLDDQDPDMPDETPESEDDGENSGGGGSGPQSGGGSVSSDDDNDIPSQVPNQGNKQSGDTSDNDGSSSDNQSGQDGNPDSDNSSNGSNSQDGQGSSDSSNGDEEGESEDGEGSGDFDDLLNDYEDDSGSDGQGAGSSDEGSEDDMLDSPKNSSELGKNDSNQGTGNGGPRGDSTDDGSETGDADLGGESGGGAGSSGASGNSGNANGQGSSNLDLDRNQVPSAEELEADDTDFDPDLGSLSELEEALKDIDQKSADSVKERRRSENTRSEQEEEQSRNSQRDRDDEIAAAKDIVGKAAKDTQSDETMNGSQTSDEDDDYNRRYNRDMSESQEDILKELGAGNLTTLFNPGNLQDWRSRLDRIFDKALGFDIITNPNLVNKKIEDAPPGREDETPQIKNIAVLLDMSGSMGAREFKQVISHIDTMLQARKLTKVWFHIIGFGTSNINDIPAYYAKVKGSKFKQTMMTKFKNDAGWMTDILPGIVFCSMKVHRPDAVIIMTDAEFNGNLSQFERDSKAKMFMKKNKNKIIWALTANARMQGVQDYDPTAISKKRYIKFKKGGREEYDW